MIIQLRSDVSARLLQSMGEDEFLIWAAKVSTMGVKSEDAQTLDPQRFINFLMDGRHGSPFEHAAMTFLIEAPIAVMRELRTHRIGMSYNEESSRYKILNPVFWVPDEGRKLRQVGKTGAYSFETAPELRDSALEEMKAAYGIAWDAYEAMLTNGVAKEVARYVLPLATYSSMYVTCNPRSLMAFLSLRTQAEGSTFPSFPLREIEQVAEQMEEQFASLFPITYDAFCRNGRVSP